MSFLLIPLFAQLATVTVGDRTDVRYSSGVANHYEGATRPSAQLRLDWPEYTLSFGYGASLTVTPLESRPRDLLVYHTAFVNTAYRFRRSVLSLSSTGLLGEVNFQRLALDPAAANPTPVPGGVSNGDPDPTGGTSGGEPAVDPAQPSSMPNVQPPQLQPRITKEAVHYGSWTNTLAFDHRVDDRLKLGAAASYSMSGGLEPEARTIYPTTRGTLLRAFGDYTLPASPRDAFVTTVTLQQGWSSLGTRVTLATANEAWNSRLGRKTSSLLGVGVAAFRAHYPEGYDSFSLYPTATAFIGHATRLEGGNLSFGVAVFVAPTLDPLRATVDPRAGTGANASWQRRLFFANLNVGTAASISKAGNDAAAFNNFSAGALAGYRITDWMQADVGGTMTQQAYRGTTTIPFSYAIMAGLSFGVSAPLGGRNR